MLDTVGAYKRVNNICCSKQIKIKKGQLTYNIV